MKKMSHYKKFESQVMQKADIKIFRKEDWTEFNSILESAKKSGIKMAWDITRKIVWDRIIQNGYFVLIDTHSNNKNHKYIGARLTDDFKIFVYKEYFAVFYNNDPVDAEEFYKYFPDFSIIHHDSQLLNQKEQAAFFKALEKMVDVKDVLEKYLDYKVIAKQISDKLSSHEDATQKFGQLASKSPRFFKLMEETLNKDDVFTLRINKDMHDWGL